MASRDTHWAEYFIERSWLAGKAFLASPVQLGQRHGRGHARSCRSTSLVLGLDRHTRFQHSRWHRHQTWYSWFQHLFFGARACGGVAGGLIYIVDSDSRFRSERMHHAPRQEQVHANNKTLMSAYIARKCQMNSQMDT